MRPVADAPVAEDDTFSTIEDVPLSIPVPGVLGNDTDADEQNLTAIEVAQPTNGLLTLRADGSFDYTPFQNFFGTDLFTYMASDGELTSDPASVTINVVPANDAPIARDDVYLVIIDTELEVDFENGPPVQTILMPTNTVNELTVQVVEDVATGMLDVAADGSFTYTPASGFSGQVTFTYAVTDGSLTSDPATVMLNVGLAGPIVVFRLATTDALGNVLTEVATGDHFELRVFVQEVNVVPIDGVFAAYTDVTFDASLATTTGTVVHADPYTNFRSGDVSTPGLIDEAGGFDGLDPLGESERLVFSVPMQATLAGELTLTADPADEIPAHSVLTFDSVTPIPTDDIEYGETTLTIIFEPTPPIAVPDAYSTLEDTLLEVSKDNGVLANDSNAGGGDLSATLDQDVQHGQLTLNADGSFTYTPETGFVGDDVFTYVAMSGD